MFIISETALLDLQASIVNVTHGLVNERGDRMSVGTIEERRLAMAALAAIQIAVGQPVWPGNEPIRIPARARLPGPFREET